jgi:glycosyltransferase involved in cell wall biosynthesis
MRVAIVYDWLINKGGAERCLEVLLEIYPKADIYTLVCDKDNFKAELSGRRVYTSFLQKIPGIRSSYRKFLPLFPTAIEQFDLRDYDLVVSFSHCVAKGVITTKDTCHICYCSTPVRYAWEFYYDYFKSTSGEGLSWLGRKLAPFVMNYIKMWDILSLNRVDYFISVADNITQKIEKYYRRDSKVVYPPVNTEYFVPTGEVGNYYLVVSRQVSYKRVDLAIKAFNELNLPLTVVGTGPENRKLKKIANKNIKFMGRLSDEELKKLYAGCKALIFPGEEDFGIVPLEVQSAGRPVIAYGKGGVLETVVNGVTGIYFNEQTKESIIEAVKKFDDKKFNSADIRRHALGFSRNIFKTKIESLINEMYKDFVNKKMENHKVVKQTKNPDLIKV